jgi:hypothetical protein
MHTLRERLDSREKSIRIGYNVSVLTIGRLPAVVQTHVLIAYTFVALRHQGVGGVTDQLFDVKSAQVEQPI